MKKIILGNGISAKVFAFYNPEYIRIAPSGESQAERKSFLHLATLHRTRWSDEFLVDIELSDVEEDELSIGYWFKDKFCQSSPEGEVMELFLRKKLAGLKPPPSLFPKESMIYKPYLGTSTLYTYKIKLEEVMGALNKKMGERGIIDAKITAIHDGFVSLSNGQSLPYSHLVSTIPATMFWEIYEGKSQEKKVFHSNSLFLQTMDYSTWLDMGHPELKDKIICYFPEKKYPFDRVWQRKELYGDEIAIEGSMKFAEAIELKNARLIRSYSNMPPPNIIFLGRYAEWNPDIMVHNVIGRSANKYMMENIWSDQKFFNKKFVNYLPDITYVQTVVKDYILHLISETDSLLNTINWKMQDSDKLDIKVNRDAVLEEWIDVYKFWLSIGLMFGFTPADFEQMYWDKSKRVKEKMK